MTQPQNAWKVGLWGLCIPALLFLMVAGRDLLAGKPPPTERSTPESSVESAPNAPLPAAASPPPAAPGAAASPAEPPPSAPAPQATSTERPSYGSPRGLDAERNSELMRMRLRAFPTRMIHADEELTKMSSRRDERD